MCKNRTLEHVAICVKAQYGRLFLPRGSMRPFSGTRCESSPVSGDAHWSIALGVLKSSFCPGYFISASNTGPDTIPKISMDYIYIYACRLNIQYSCDPVPYLERNRIIFAACFFARWRRKTLCGYQHGTRKPHPSVVTSHLETQNAFTWSSRRETDVIILFVEWNHLEREHYFV